MVTRMKTTIEITDELLERAKEAARRERTTLRSLVEEGLRHTLDRHDDRGAFRLRDASVGGRGPTPEFRGASWERLRDAAYGGPRA
jgi:Arc/MetJ family transcription regulator